MRRYRRMRKKKQRKLLILVVCSIFVFMSVGYAAMQTELNIGAKGNVVKKVTGAEAILDQVNIVTTGDGLYKDSYEENQYIYRGSNPNNYITFNNEQWRIVSVNTNDNTIKIIRNEVLEDRVFHSSFCSTAYNITDKEVKKDKNGIYQINRIDYLFVEPPPVEVYLGCNKWDEPAELNTYLNEVYYNNTLSEVARNQIEESWFNVGPVSYSSNYSLSDNMEQSKSAKWQGKIGLIDVTEYVKASTNSVCDSVYDFYSNGSCYNDAQDYLDISDIFWTISPRLESDSGFVFYIDSNGNLNHYDAYYSRGVRPVVYLSPNIQITGGDGSQNDPYELTI